MAFAVPFVASAEESTNVTVVSVVGEVPGSGAAERPAASHMAFTVRAKTNGNAANATRRAIGLPLSKSDGFVD